MNHTRNTTLSYATDNDATKDGLYVRFDRSLDGSTGQLIMVTEGNAYGQQSQSLRHNLVKKEMLEDVVVTLTRALEDWA